ncbi:MAG: VOC family protein [Pseudobdellovibrionaceae bacterium]
MKGMNTYLMFSGNCQQAMKFYNKCLGGELHMMPYAEMPGNVPPEAKNHIMHACLTSGPTMFMASDLMPGTEKDFKMGNNFSVSINCESKTEVDTLMNALKEGGKITMPASDTFWGAYFGMLTDQFGVNWMFNHDTGKKN